MGTSALDRAADRVADVCARPTDLVSMWTAVTAILAQVVPHYWAPCCYTLDPASLLITSHFQDGLPEFPAEWLSAEYYGDDVNKLADVARSSAGSPPCTRRPAANPTGSPRWQANMQMGGDQELILSLRTRTGEVWGALGLYREPDRPLFDAMSKALPARGRPGPGQRVRAGHCWSARRPSPRARPRRGWSSSTAAGEVESTYARR